MIDPTRRDFLAAAGSVLASSSAVAGGAAATPINRYDWTPS